MKKEIQSTKGSISLKEKKIRRLFKQTPRK